MANTQSLPNSISLYIDLLGILFSGCTISYFALPAASVKSVIGHYYADLALGASREFTLSKVSEEFNLHSTPQCTLFINPACRQFPKALRLTDQAD